MLTSRINAQTANGVPIGRLALGVNPVGGVFGFCWSTKIWGGHHNISFGLTLVAKATAISSDREYHKDTERLADPVAVHGVEAEITCSDSFVALGRSKGR